MVAPVVWLELPAQTQQIGIKISVRKIHTDFHIRRKDITTSSLQTIPDLTGKIRGNSIVSQTSPGHRINLSRDELTLLNRFFLPFQILIPGRQSLFSYGHVPHINPSTPKDNFRNLPFFIEV